MPQRSEVWLQIQAPEVLSIAQAGRHVLYAPWEQVDGRHTGR